MTVVKWILIVLCICILISAWALILSINEWFREKTTNMKIINTNELSKGNRDTFSNRLNASLDLLELCGAMIDNEISRSITNCVMLEMRYDLTRLTDDAAFISQKVFNSIKKETFMDDNLLLSDECFLAYITDETICKLLLTAKNYNNSLSN